MASCSSFANAAPQRRLGQSHLPHLDCKAIHSSDDAGHAAQEPSTSASTSRRLLLGQAAGLVMACGCSWCLKPRHGMAAEPERFTYGDDLGRPQQWGGTCATGGRQSPIDLPAGSGIISITGRSMQSCLGPIAFAYQPCSGEDASILNPGIGTMQVTFAKGLQSCNVGSLQLVLLQCHFHAPSEHAFAGRHAAMEAHLVHRNQLTGSLAVLATLMQVGPDPGTNLNSDGSNSNPLLQAALQHAPAQPLQTVPCPVRISPMDLIPPPDAFGMRHYVHYSGSLTTPPCSEGVDWIVFREPVSVTATQVNAFKVYVTRSSTTGSNARATQPIHERPLEYDCFNRSQIANA